MYVSTGPHTSSHRGTTTSIRSSTNNPSLHLCRGSHFNHIFATNYCYIRVFKVSYTSIHVHTGRSFSSHSALCLYTHRKLRSIVHNQILIHMCLSLIGLYVTFIVSSFGSRLPTVVCGIFSGLLHYFMLVYFFWTAAESILLYQKLVTVLGGEIEYYTKKAAIVVWRKYLEPIHYCTWDP